jgi:hypothetical protein
MRAAEEVERRLKKLTSRYKERYLAQSQGRFHKSCIHNRTHMPTSTVKSESSKMWESSMSPRRQVTLIVMQPEAPIGICMYGSEKSETWNGNTCDDDSVSEECPYFAPSQSKEDASAEFDSMLKDDALVLAEYPDVAALQWVLQARSWEIPDETAQLSAEVADARTAMSDASFIISGLRHEIRRLEERPAFMTWLGGVFRRFRRPTPLLPGGRDDTTEDP